MIKRFTMTLAVIATVALAAVPTTAAQPQQSGLVNVAVVGNTVQIPVGIAANVCGVTANILAHATVTAPVNCTATSQAGATAQARGRQSGGSQDGLVNLFVADNVIQVPVGIAANICGVAANILSAATVTGTATCTATANGSASG